MKVKTMDAAMHWLLKLRDESVTEEDIAAWMEWYESDERNKQSFDEMQAFWHSTGDLALLPDGPARLHRLRSYPLPRERGARRMRRAGGHGWTPWAFAEQGLRSEMVREGAFIYRIAAAVLLTLAAILSWQYFTREPSAVTPSITASVRESVLPDGSRLQLAAKSFVDVRYTEHERLLQFQSGEAHFQVAPNRNQPFVVQVEDMKVRALGTAFNIRKAAERIVITVDDGRVEVSQGGKEPVQLAAGSQLVYDAHSADTRRSAVDPSRALAWRDGRLEYIDEPLSAVIADINRYSRRPVVIQDPAVAQLAFTGTVFTRNVEEWLQALPGEFSVNLIADGGDAWLLAGRPESRGKPQ